MQWTPSHGCVHSGALFVCHGTCRCSALQVVVMIYALLFELWVWEMHYYAHCGTCNGRAMHPMALVCSLPCLYWHRQAVSHALYNTGKCIVLRDVALVSVLP